LASLALALFVASTAFAHHRQTPPIVTITTSGDGALPRLPPPSKKAAAVTVDTSIALVGLFKNPTIPTFEFSDGTNANPSISKNGRNVVWATNADPLGSGAPGTQIVSQNGIGMSQVAVDPTGTSTNPAVDMVGLYTAFESTGQLAGPGSGGTKQVFLAGPGGTITQLSRGQGTSGNPSVGRRGRLAVFQSTSHPTSGVDTGIDQIWLADFLQGTTEPITSGLGASTSPCLSNDGRVVSFESRADLAGDGHDTGTPQVFTYDTRTETFARITNEPGGCVRPSIGRIKRDWRIAYLCGGRPYFSMLRANQRFEVQTGGGDTTRIVPQDEVHFVLVATTANLAGSGTTPQHRVYMVNLFARPPATAPSAILWFPFQGLSPL
jgi:Tol biopolymer transport system component